MGWTCRRPGCHREAAATIGYDPVACQVWLDLLGDGPAPAQMLCQHHAERLRAPRGWVVVDRRGDQMVIVTADAAPEPPAPSRATPRPRRPPRRRWGRLDEPSFEFTLDENAAAIAMPDPELEPQPVLDVEVPVEPEPVLEVEEAAEPEPEPAPEPEPKPEPEPELVLEPEPEPERESEPVDDVGSLLKPTGRLLSRAFAQTGDQRSALSALATAGEPTEPEPDPVAE
jgi:hypothetical protein